jgi:hypothetical protein
MHLAHGYGLSVNGDTPLIDHWAAQRICGNPTHIPGHQTLGLAADDSRRISIWRTRIDDMKIC